MYPYPILFGMTLYEIFIIVGVIGVMITFRFFGDRYKFSARLQNLVLFNTDSKRYVSMLKFPKLHFRIYVIILLLLQ